MRLETTLRLLVEVAITVLLWTSICAIPDLEYDDNYALFLYSLILSIIMYLLAIAYWIKRRHCWKTWLLDAILYTLAASPVTYILVGTQLTYRM